MPLLTGRIKMIASSSALKGEEEMRDEELLIGGRGSPTLAFPIKKFWQFDKLIVCFVNMHMSSLS